MGSSLHCAVYILIISFSPLKFNRDFIQFISTVSVCEVRRSFLYNAVGSAGSVAEFANHYDIIALFVGVGQDNRSVLADFSAGNEYRLAVFVNVRSAAAGVVIFAPSVSQVIVTFCEPLNVPPFGEITGVATVSLTGRFIVNSAVTTVLFSRPSLTATALITVEVIPM